VVKASLFGSVVRGDTHKKSDVDFLIQVPSKYRGLDYFGFLGDIRRELEQRLNSKVDIVDYRLIKPALKKNILADQIQIL